MWRSALSPRASKQRHTQFIISTGTDAIVNLINASIAIMIAINFIYIDIINELWCCLYLYIISLIIYTITITPRNNNARAACCTDCPARHLQCVKGAGTRRVDWLAAAAAA